MEYYRRENYLKRIRNFYDDGSIIKVITGIRRCGKSTLLKSIIEELQEKGVPEKDIIYIELDKKEFKKIVTPEQLEEEIKVPENLNSVLRYYQKTGFKWLKILDRYHFGGILADDMGLRKNYSNVIGNS